MWRHLGFSAIKKIQNDKIDLILKNITFYSQEMIDIWVFYRYLKLTRGKLNGAISNQPYNFTGEANNLSRGTIHNRLSEFLCV